MIQGILVTAGYFLISFIVDFAILGSIGNKMKNMDDKVGIQAEDKNASPIFVTLSTARICGLIYLINLLYSKEIPVVIFVAIAVLEICIGMAQMLKHDNMGLPHIRNYFTGKTIGSFIGLALMAYWSYFK